jgi:hypothetical protein
MVFANDIGSRRHSAFRRAHIVAGCLDQRVKRGGGLTWIAVGWMPLI